MSFLSFNAHLVRADLAHQAADVVPGGSPREVINGYGRKAKRKSGGNGNGMGRNPVKERTKGTWLTRYLDLLDGTGKAAFEAALWRAPCTGLPKNAAGQTLFPLRRLFIVAQRNS